LKLLTSTDADEIKSIILDIKHKWGDFRSNENTSIYQL